LHAPRWLQNLIEQTGFDDLVNDVHRHSIPAGRLAKIRKWASENQVSRRVELLAYDFIDRLGPKLEALIPRDSQGNTGVMREDLYEAFVSFILEDPIATNVLDVMHGVLDNKHYEMLEIAIAADNFRGQGLMREARELIEDAMSHFGDDVRKINALYAAGYIHTVFVWEYAMRKAFGGSGAVAAFNIWFKDQLRFFDEALFVSGEVDEEHIWSGVERRLFGAGLNKSAMRVWVAGVENIRRVVTVLDKMVAEIGRDGRDRINYRTQLSNYGPTIGVEFYVFKEGTANFRPGRLPMMWERGS